MRVYAKEFTSMKGHVADGCEIIGSDGRVYTLKNTMSGWRVSDAANTEISGNLKSAFDVECFVVYGLGI